MILQGVLGCLLLTLDPRHTAGFNGFKLRVEGRRVSAVSEGGCYRGDEWLHKGIVGNGLTVAFLMALYERWRESDGSHMEPTITRTCTHSHARTLTRTHSHAHSHTLTRTHLHTHTLTHSCPPSRCFGETPAPVSPLVLSVHLSLPLYPSHSL